MWKGLFENNWKCHPHAGNQKQKKESVWRQNKDYVGGATCWTYNSLSKPWSFVPIRNKVMIWECQNDLNNSSSDSHWHWLMPDVNWSKYATHHLLVKVGIECQILSQKQFLAYRRLSWKKPWCLAQYKTFELVFINYFWWCCALRCLLIGKM